MHLAQPGGGGLELFVRHVVQSLTPVARKASDQTSSVLSGSEMRPAYFGLRKT